MARKKTLAVSDTAARDSESGRDAAVLEKPAPPKRETMADASPQTMTSARPVDSVERPPRIVAPRLGTPAARGPKANTPTASRNRCR